MACRSGWCNCEGELDRPEPTVVRRVVATTQYAPLRNITLWSDQVVSMCHDTGPSNHRHLGHRWPIRGDEGFEQAKAWVEALGKDLRGK
jgi:hypothetical protein